MPGTRQAGRLVLIRIGSLVFKELIQFRRDVVLAAFVILAPALQLILMAQAVEQGISKEPVVILDQDHSRLSRQLAVNLDNTEELRVAYYVDSPEEMRRLLDEGQARVAVIIPNGLAREFGSLLTTQGIQIIGDATNSVAAATTMGAAAGAVRRLSSELGAGHGPVMPELIDVRTDVRFNPEMDFRDYSIPAQLGFITYQITLAVASLGLARERELGTLEQLMVTPLRRLELAVGKGVPAIFVGGLNFVIMWGISLTLFQVPMNGSVVLLAALTLLFVTAVVNWGLVISAISRTQQQAILFVVILAMVEIAFSGYLVPVKNLPPLLQFISRFAPLQHYLVIIRSIMLKGAGLSELWPQVLALVALSLTMGTISLGIVTRHVE
ncbi:ABC transporter permease [Chloroflexota bacterium]